MNLPLGEDQMEQASVWRCRRTSFGAIKISLIALLGTASFCLISASAMAQLTYTELVFDGSGFTGVTGNPGGLLYGFSTGAFQPFPMATANGSNFPGAISSTPYGPTFGAPTGILR